MEYTLSNLVTYSCERSLLAQRRTVFTLKSGDLAKIKNTFMNLSAKARKKHKNKFYELAMRQDEFRVPRRLFHKEL
jgi:hypothetical protein